MPGSPEGASPRRARGFMRRVVRTLAVLHVLAASSPASSSAAPQQGSMPDRPAPPAAMAAHTDPQQVLSAARQAMGGEAALSSVASFVVTGSAARNLGRHVAEQSVEIACQLPDRFVRTVSYNAVFGGPGDIRMILTTRDGFTGTRLIRETTSSGDLPAPPLFLRFGPAPTDEERAARERAAVTAQKAALARLALVLFAASHSGYPLEFSSAGPVSLPNGRTADAVDARGPDGAVIRLLVDSTSHLPVMLTWKEKPVVVARRSEVVAVQQSAVVAVPVGGAAGAGTPRAAAMPVVPLPPAKADPSVAPGTVLVDDLPAGDPAAGLPFVEHALSLTEFKVADGLNWPHRFVERVEGQVLEDLRLRKIKLNPRIAESKFKASDPPR